MSLRSGAGRPRKEAAEPVEPKKRGRPKQENPRYKTKEYRRELYHLHKKEMKCECCGKIYKSLDCFRSHQKNSRTCFILQMLNVENIKEHLNALNPKVGKNIRNYWKRLRKSVVNKLMI
jgi:hypothetical protein